MVDKEGSGEKETKVREGDPKGILSEDDDPVSKMILDDLYGDSDVLREVQAELRAEDRRLPNYAAEDRLDLPALPHVEPFNSTWWMLQQVKRLFVVVLAFYILYYGGKGLVNLLFPRPDMSDIVKFTVELPKRDRAKRIADRELKVRLDKGRSQLASANTSAGLLTLTDLAEHNPDSVLGQKAMLTLAATYRFNQGRPEEAIRWYRKYLEAKPTGRKAAETMIRLASLLEDLERAPEAIEVYESVLDKFPAKVRYTSVARQGIERIEKKH